MYKRDVVNAYACASLLYVSPRHPLTVAYGRQRDARVAYVHNTVHRYRGGGCRGLAACAHACIRACACARGAFDVAASRTVQRPASRIEIARSKR